VELRKMEKRVREMEEKAEKLRNELKEKQQE